MICLLFIATMSTILLVRGDQCPYNSVLSSDMSTCLAVIQDVSTWTAAESICNYRGGHLLSVDSQKTSDYLMSQMSNLSIYAAYYFIGGIYKNGAWMWQDGTSFGYTNFYPNQINTATEGSLLAMRGQSEDGKGQWDITVPDAQYRFICRLPLCSKTNLPMILNPNNTNTGLYFGEASNRFYAGNAQNSQQMARDENACLNMGGYLPSVQNAFVNAEIQIAAEVLLGKMFGSYEYNIALGYSTTPPMGEGPWTWYDGSNSTFTKWAPGEPENFGFTYAGFDVSSGRWYALINFDYFPYICELPVPRLSC